MRKAILVACCVALPSASGAWPWGLQSFEECVAKEMKGRTRDQQSIVEDSCRKQFPALAAFTKRAKTGKLLCYSDFMKSGIVVTVQSSTVAVGSCSYTVVHRDAQWLRAHSSKGCPVPDWSKGTDFVLNLETGAGSFSDPSGSRQYIVFESCKPE